MGEKEGISLGLVDGTVVGDREGRSDGILVICLEGMWVGRKVGTSE